MRGSNPIAAGPVVAAAALFSKVLAGCTKVGVSANDNAQSEASEEASPSDFSPPTSVRFNVKQNRLVAIWE